MKTSLALLFIQAYGAIADQFYEPPRSSKLRRAQSTNGHRRSKVPCLIILSEREYADHHKEDQPVECELQAEDRQTGAISQTVKIRGLTTKWARKNNILSGETTIYAEDSLLDDSSNELIMPSNATIKIGRGKIENTNNNAKNDQEMLDPSDMFWNRKLAGVIKKVLVLRITAQDQSTTASETTLADDIFGASTDLLNLKSQYNKCSFGELQFEPLTTNALVGADGVYTVNMPTTIVTGQADNPIAWAAVSKAEQDLGVPLTSIADHVMVCMPPGTTGGWIAYAYVNHWLSVYNNVWCQYPSGQMHEIGHNLNLGHSGEGTAEYDDQSCMMGYSYGSDESPNMCFNGAKTWQLGWFPTFQVDLSVANGYNWSGDLIGFVDKNNAAATDKMIIRIQSSPNDFYIHFNRATGFNAETQEGGNQVLVTSRSSGTGYAPSLLLAKLSIGGVYSIANFNGNANALTITVNNISTAATPGRANISVVFDPSPTLPPTSAPTLPPTPQPTSAQTLPPTPQPTRAQTLPPTPQPTSAQTLPPTPQPTRAPTSASPTRAPTTKSPTRPPTTKSPTPPPTKKPTRKK